MPRVDPYGHRLSRYQPLLDLANTKLSQANYRTLVSGGNLARRFVVFPGSSDDRVALWDRSNRLAGMGVSQHRVAALQMLLRANLAIEIDGTDPLRKDPARRFVLFGRRPYEKVDLRLSFRPRKNLEGQVVGSGVELTGDDRDLQDYWYKEYSELMMAFKNPPDHLIAPFDRGLRYPLRPLARCGGPHCHQIFFKRTTRSRFCSRRCEYRFHKTHSKHGPEVNVLSSS